MSWNFIGATLNLTHLAGMQRTYRVRFEKNGGEEVDMTNCTFHGNVTDTDGNVSAIVCWGLDGTPFELGMQFPALNAGNYRLEVWLNDDGGESVRIFSGSLLVMSTSVSPPTRVYSGYKTLVVQVPSEEDERLQAQFLASSAAEFSAVIAGREADRAKSEADRAAQIATGIQNYEEEIKKKLDECEELLEACKEEYASILNNISSSISIDDADGTWIIGGYDTNKPSRGENGKSPYIQDLSNLWVYFDSNGDEVVSNVCALGKDGCSPYIDDEGYWWQFSDSTQKFEQTTICGKGKNGKDGLNADSIHRKVVNSYAEIPQSGDTCNGHYYYYIKKDSGQPDAGTAYMWGENEDGTSGWINIGNTWDIATIDIIGGMRLSSDEIVEDVINNENGGLIGRDSLYRLYARPATYENYGVVLAGSAKNVTNDIPYKVSPAIAVTNEGGKERRRLANNLLSDGALQHMEGKPWKDLSFPWLTSTLDNGQYYLGLKTSGSFKQSKDGGLEINPPQEDLLGGVLKATNADLYKTETSGDHSNEKAYPNVAQTKTIVKSLTWTQSDVYTKEATDAKIAQELKKYYTSSTVERKLSEIEERIMSACNSAIASAVNQAKKALIEKIRVLLVGEKGQLESITSDGLRTDLQTWVLDQGFITEFNDSLYMRRSDSVDTVKVLSKSAHDDLPNPDAKTLYISGDQ